MSHISKIEIEIRSLEDLKEACKELGFEFCEGQQTYRWYGTYLEDTELPENVAVEDLGTCNHAIRVPGARYEIGILKKEDRYQLLWDSWRTGGLEKRIGKNAGLLKQAYTLQRIKREARIKGYRVVQQKMDQGMRLVLTV